MMLVELNAVPNAALPVAEFSQHLHLGSGFADDGAQNAVLEAYLLAAMAAIETRIGKVLLQRDFSWNVTGWRTADAQSLPVAPVSAITAVKLLDQAGSETLVPASVYQLQKDSQRPKLAASGAYLPPVPTNGSAEIEFTAGFGPSWTDVPVDLAQAVLLLATHYYENRRGEGGQDAMMPFGVMALIETYRTVRLFGGGA